jgi:hypothetical protein
MRTTTPLKWTVGWALIRARASEPETSIRVKTPIFKLQEISKDLRNRLLK